MSGFSFLGTLPVSKSIMNRALIIQSYYPDFLIEGINQSDDVSFMKKGIQQILNFQAADCGHAGTVLRFLALRASRIPGEHKLVGSSRLFERPQEDLLKTLRQLSVEAEIRNDTLFIRSQGWKLLGDALIINTDISSQFASALFLNSWSLNFDLPVVLNGSSVSQSYFYMTMSMLEHLGMSIKRQNSEFYIPNQQALKKYKYKCEIDLSSAFAIAALAAVSGNARIQNFPVNSLQPDSSFVGILKKMNIPVDFDKETLIVKKSSSLKGVEVNLKECPDLFPVLSALCALSPDRSVLRGAAHLKFKESNRIQAISDLLLCIGRKHEVLDDGVIIEAQDVSKRNLVIVFDPEEDHRMAMAASVLRQAGYMIRIENRHVVNKSFPEFWDCFEGL